MKSLAELRKDEFDPKAAQDFLEKLAKDVKPVWNEIKDKARHAEGQRRMRKHPRTGGMPYLHRSNRVNQ